MRIVTPLHLRERTDGGKKTLDTKERKRKRRVYWELKGAGERESVCERGETGMLLYACVTWARKLTTNKIHIPLKKINSAA